jgi:hypothetical protein
VDDVRADPPEQPDQVAKRHHVLTGRPAPAERRHREVRDAERRQLVDVRPGRRRAGHVEPLLREPDQLVGQQHLQRQVDRREVQQAWPRAGGAHFDDLRSRS